MTDVAGILHERLSRPPRVPGQVTVGIAGGSGAGKSTLAADLAARLVPLRVEVVGLDRFFKPADELPRYASAHHGDERPDWNRPDSVRVDAMVAACGAPADADVVLLDGHLLLCYPRMRDLLDVALYVDMDLERMLARRTARNLANGYGGSAEEMAHYCRECVIPGFEQHIWPSRRWADLTIPNDDGDDTARDAIMGQVVAAIRRHADS